VQLPGCSSARQLPGEQLTVRRGDGGGGGGDRSDGGSIDRRGSGGLDGSVSAVWAARR
jgi:hypothetical protein